MQTITEKIPINDLINNNPDVIPVLMGYGLHCVGCSFAKHETLSSGARLHGFDEEKIKKALKLK